LQEQDPCSSGVKQKKPVAYEQLLFDSSSYEFLGTTKARNGIFVRIPEPILKLGQSDCEEGYLTKGLIDILRSS
jgi:hypothetical protein